MDINELTEILKRCGEDKSINELLKQVGVNEDDMEEGESVKIKIAFTKKKDGGVSVKVSREEVSDDEKKLDELEEYRNELEEKYDALVKEEPDDSDGVEHEVWEIKVDDLRDLIMSVEDKIDDLEDKIDDAENGGEDDKNDEDD